MQSLNTDLLIDGATKTGRRKHFFSQYFALFVLLIFCMYQYGIHRIYGFSIYPDEFGYWAYAAKGLDYDWSDVTALGYYYSFGYSLILTPLLKIFSNSVSAYRAAVTVNMLFQCVSVGLLYGIFREIDASLCPDTECPHVLFAVGAAAFYPVWSFYTQMTLTEALLTFLYLLVCRLFISFFKKPDLKTQMLLSIAFLYLYFVHMRTVGVVLAAVFTMLLYTWENPACRKNFLPGIIVLAAGAGIGLWMKTTLTNTVYHALKTGQMGNGNYAGQLGRLKTIFTVKGLTQLFTSCAGKLYYLGLASFGLFYPAIGICLRKTKELLKKRIFLFLLLSMTGQFLISAVFMDNTFRLDALVYGRYNDYLLPVFIGLGMLVLLKSRHPFRIFGISAGISTLLFGITLGTAMQSDNAIMQGYFAAGISYLSNEVDYQILPEFVKAYLFGILLMGIVTGCTWFCRVCSRKVCLRKVCLRRRIKTEMSALGILLFMEISLTFCLNGKYIYFFNDVNYYDLRVFEYIEQYEAAPVTYLYGGGLPYIDLIQFALRDRKVAVIREDEIKAEIKAEVEAGIKEETEAEIKAGIEAETETLRQQLDWQILESNLPENEFLIADKDSEYLTELEAKYKKCTESEGFILFFTE